MKANFSFFETERRKMKAVFFKQRIRVKGFCFRYTILIFYVNKSVDLTKASGLVEPCHLISIGSSVSTSLCSSSATQCFITTGGESFTGLSFSQQDIDVKITGACFSSRMFQNLSSKIKCICIYLIVTLRKKDQMISMYLTDPN